MTNPNQNVIGVVQVWAEAEVTKAENTDESKEDQ